MWLTLAQAAETANPGSADASLAIIPRIFNRLDTLAHPDNLVTTLEQAGVVLSSIFVAIGLLCLLQGYRLYKGVVLLLALVIGLAIGWQLGTRIQAEIIVAGCCGVLLAVVAWPLMKYAVTVCAGLAGAFIGANVWSSLASQMNTAGGVGLDPNSYWAGALMGLILFGMLGFVLFKLSVVVFTSVSGSTLAVLGIIALLLQIPAWQQSIGEAIRANPMIIPILVAVPAVVGLVLQQQMGALRREPAESS